MAADDVRRARLGLPSRWELDELDSNAETAVVESEEAPPVGPPPGVDPLEWAYRVLGYRTPEDVRAELARDDELRWEIFERDGYACQRCGSRRRLTIDHVTPVSRGGGNDSSNLETLCRMCNSSKGAR